MSDKAIPLREQLIEKGAEAILAARYPERAGRHDHLPERLIAWARSDSAAVLDAIDLEGLLRGIANGQIEAATVRRHYLHEKAGVASLRAQLGDAKASQHEQGKDYAADMELLLRQRDSLRAQLREREEERDDAEARLRLAKDALLRDGYFKPEQIDGDIAPRIIERLAAITSERDEAKAEVERVRTFYEGMAIRRDRAAELGDFSFPPFGLYPPRLGHHEIRDWLNAAFEAGKCAPLSAEEAEPQESGASLLEAAWGIIANASGGDWSKEPQDWQACAARWRDEYHLALSPVQDDHRTEKEKP